MNKFLFLLALLNISLQDNIYSSFSKKTVANITSENTNRLKNILHKKRSSKKDFANPQKIEVENVTLECDATGFPTTNAIKNLMVEQYFSHEIADTIEVNIKYLEGNEGRIYIISLVAQPKRAIFFLKISTRFSQKDLTRIQEGDIGRKIVQARYADSHLSIPKKNLPIIAWVEKFFIYKDPQGKEKIIEITHAAQGLPVYNIIKQYHEYMIPCGHAVGTALGSFQQAFMDYVNPESPSTWRTVAHSDFHTGNILYNPKTKQVYFIDIATMSSNCDIKTDFEYLIFHPAFRNDQYEKEFITKWTQYNDFFDAIFKGYIESFPQSKQAILAAYLLQYVHETLTRMERNSPRPIVYVFEDKVALYLKKILLSDPVLALQYNISPLTQAIVAEDIATITTLLAKGANPNQEDGFADTPLYWAMMTNTDLIPLLHRYGANIDAQDKNNVTLLQRAIEGNNQKAIKALLATGANPNISDEYQNTPLFSAIRASNLFAVEALLFPTNKYVSDINQSNPNKQTPLHFAIEQITYSKFSPEGVKVIKRLLQSPNINIHAKDFSGKTPLALLAQNCLSSENQDQYIAIAQMLLDAGADIDSIDQNQQTPLSNCSHWLAYLKIPYKNLSHILEHEQNLQKSLIQTENADRQRLQKDFIDNKQWIENRRTIS